MENIVYLKCEICGLTKETLRERTDPENLHTILSRCFDCNKKLDFAHVVVKYLDASGNILKYEG